MWVWVGVGAGMLALVFLACHFGQRSWGAYETREVAKKLRKQRIMEADEAGLNLNVEPPIKADLREESPPARALLVGGGPVLAFDWTREHKYWIREAATIRHTF